MPFGVATVFTNKGKAAMVDRYRTAATYTTEQKWIAMGVGATGAARTAAKTDTALSTEVETRAVGVSSIVTTTTTGDTYQTTGTQTATSARAVDEGATFDQLATGGNIGVSWTQNVDNLNIGDSIQWTVTIQLT